jgi:hypothetical protein
VAALRNHVGRVLANREQQGGVRPPEGVGG